jgi:hypothetical protein
MAAIDSALTTVRSTLAGVLGASGGPFDNSGPVRLAQLTIDADARVPSGTKLLQSGRHFDAVVRTAVADADEATVRTLCVKIRDAYGSGRDQDFLLASSADGVPFHHLTLPAASESERLYSSLWIYLAGLRPVLFGARATGVDEYEFLLSDVIGRFRRIGVLHLGTPDDDGHDIEFAARNSGGGLRPLPPVSLYNAG